MTQPRRNTYLETQLLDNDTIRRQVLDNIKGKTSEGIAVSAEAKVRAFNEAIDKLGRDAKIPMETKEGYNQVLAMVETGQISPEQAERAIQRYRTGLKFGLTLGEKAAWYEDKAQIAADFRTTAKTVKGVAFKS